MNTVLSNKYFVSILFSYFSKIYYSDLKTKQTKKTPLFARTVLCNFVKY